MKQAIVIFGSTGNLTYKKLLPAIHTLIKRNRFKNEDKIFLLARHELTLEEYIEQAKEFVTENLDWNLLKPYLEYVYFQLDESNYYQRLREKLEDLGFNNNVFYLALPPTLFPKVAKGISEAKLIQKKEDTKRIVFEKPFGDNITNAEQINRELWKYFDESQIYRIDHYLGKEMIQNILVVRFANKIFEQTWNRSTIRNIIIIAKEPEGVMLRGNYYDKVGALIDMLQSHLLQMAALIAMSKPKSFDSEDVKDAKIQVFNDMKIDPNSVLFGQYNGYLNEQKISPQSETETFIFAKACIDNSKWKDIPIYFITGKKLDEKRSEIIVNFKDDKSLTKIFSDAKPNNSKLIIKVAPEDGVLFQLNVKQPGLGEEIISGNLNYCHSCNWVGNNSQAYEKLLLDVLNHNRTLFTRWDEIEAMWNVVDEIQHMSHPLFVYEDYQNIRDIILKEKGVDINDL